MLCIVNFFIQMFLFFSRTSSMTTLELYIRQPLYSRAPVLSARVLVPTCSNNNRNCRDVTMLRPSSSFVANQRLISMKERRSNQRSKAISFHSCRLWMMPEGPEVRTLCDQLQPAVGMQLKDIYFLSGRYVTHGVPVGFAEFYPTLINNQHDQRQNVVQQWRVKGKFMYIILDHGYCGNNISHQEDWQRSIWITLGMSGRFVNEKRSSQQTTPARWYMEFSNKTKLFYYDPRNFGTLRFSLSRQELQNKLESLGPDILWSEDLFPVEMFLNIVKKQNPQLNICKFLMDQKRISGIGNYLLAEGLYKAKVDPYASLNELSDDQYRVLFHKLRTTAQKSYRANGVTRASGGTYTDTYGEPGKFVFELECYGRDIASNHQPVIQDTNGPHGRTIWYTKEQLFMPLTQRHSLSTISSMETRSNTKPNLDSTSTSPISFPISGGTTAHLTSSLSKSSEVSSVEALSAYLTEPSWKEALSPYISSSDEFQMIASFLAKEYDQGITIFPPKHEIFAALNYCPLYNVKVVIVGQDPYFNPNQGHGLAFSVREGVPIPPSLKNIFKEAIADVGIRPPTSGCLESWAKQGVLLLNTVLTVRSGEPNSHAGKGWESFTDHILQTVNKELDGVVFLLWGAPAAKKAALVNRKKNHAVIQCSHPSPLSATKTKTPFLGSRCFSRVNAALDNLGEDEIDWNIT